MKKSQHNRQFILLELDMLSHHTDLEDLHKSLVPSDFFELVSKCENPVATISVSSNAINSDVYVSSILLPEGKNIGYQRHATVMNSNTSDSISLGAFRNNIKQVEPILRDAKQVSINLNVLKSCEAPAIHGVFPSGMTTEELCQIARYAGESNHIEKLHVIFHADDSKLSSESMIVAQLFWYFVEGMSFDKSIHPNSSKSFQEFVIESRHDSLSYHFFQSTQNGKWWLKTFGNAYIACSQEDYVYTKEHGLPDRLLYAL